MRLTLGFPLFYSAPLHLKFLLIPMLPVETLVGSEMFSWPSIFSRVLLHSESQFDQCIKAHFKEQKIIHLIIHATLVGRLWNDLSKPFLSGWCSVCLGSLHTDFKSCLCFNSISDSGVRSLLTVIINSFLLFNSTFASFILKLFSVL